MCLDGNVLLSLFGKNIIMKHLIEVDDSSHEGKNLIEFLKSLSRRHKYISLTENDFPSVKDSELVAEIKKGLKSGIADRNRVLRKMGLK